MISMVFTCAGCEKRSAPLNGYEHGWKRCSTRLAGAQDTIEFYVCSGACMFKGVQAALKAGKTQGCDWVSTCDACGKLVGASPLADDSTGIDVQVMSWNLHACNAECLEKAVNALPVDDES
jgi:hypothetical protein